MLSTSPPAFVAAVDVIPRRARTVVTLGTRIQTVSEETAARDAGPDGLPQLGLAATSAERRQALVRLVRSPDVAQAVRDELKDELPLSCATCGPCWAPWRGRRPADGADHRPGRDAQRRLGRADRAGLGPGLRAPRQSPLRRSRGRGGGTARLEGELGRAKSSYDAAEAALTQFESTSRLSEYKHLLEARNESIGSSPKR